MKRKIALLMAAVMLFGVTVGATIAYLTSTTSVVTNTFTAGKVEITLDEAKVNEKGKIIAKEDRHSANTYDLFPGSTYDKDPRVNVQSTSEDCWLFVKVVNPIAAIEADTTIENQMIAKGWVKINADKNIWAYPTIAKANDKVYLFETVTISGTVTDISSYNNAQITVQAYAVQAENFTTYEAAWTAAPLAAWTNA